MRGVLPPLLVVVAWYAREPDAGLVA